MIAKISSQTKPFRAIHLFFFFEISLNILLPFCSPSSETLSPFGVEKRICSIRLRGEDVGSQRNGDSVLLARELEREAKAHSSHLLALKSRPIHLHVSFVKLFKDHIFL